MTSPGLLDRRTLLATLLAGVAAAPLRAAEGGAADPVAAALDRLLSWMLDTSPELATRAGLDVGPRAAERRELDRRSSRAAAALRAGAVARSDALDAVPAMALDARDRIDLAAVKSVLGAQAAIARGFAFGEALDPHPYVVSHLTGAAVTIPDFLATKHPIAVAADADAYVARIAAFGQILAEETARMTDDARRGVAPPDFIIDRAIVQMRALHDQSAAQSGIVTALSRKLSAAGLPQTVVPAAAAAVDRHVRPAVAEQLAALGTLRAGARGDAGVWRLPDGDAYYRAALRSCLTRDTDPAALHETGLRLVAEQGALLDGLLRTQGLTRGTLAERIGALLADPKLVYPDTDAGRAAFMAAMEAKLARMRGLLGTQFRHMPAVPLDIRRVPAEREDGAPPAYYEDPSLDGRRPGTFYINLHDLADTPLWMVTSTVYHESIPGHHLQQALLLEGAPLPLVRKILAPDAYAEGWALYAEQLADEQGAYDGDPLGRIGYVLTTLLRACRLVGDTGVHSLRWTRAQTIAWLVEHGGIPAGLAVNEVERYCVWPAQACSYMVGKLEILRLRDKARAALGARFDPRDFHEAVLGSGAVPLDVLDTIVDGYVARTAGMAARAVPRP